MLRHCACNSCLAPYPVLATAPGDQGEAASKLAKLFVTTHWSAVLAARDPSSPRAAEASEGTLPRRADCYSMGSIEEAVIAREIMASVWGKSPEAQVWLRSQGSKRSGAQRREKETMR